VDLIDAINGRCATRAFTPEPVDPSVIDALIAAAVRAPSAMNEQPWDFCVVEGTEKLDQISKQAAAHMADTIQKGRLTLHHASLDDPHFNIFYHAPVLVVISAKSGPWMVEHAALAAANLMLAAYGRGLGSCWIGLAQRWLETENGRRALQTPEDFIPVAPIIIGHPAGRSVQAPRHPPRVRWLH
jgi:nitroreductase